MINESVAHVLAEMGLINEVFLVSRGKPSNARWVLSYRDKVWLFSDNQIGSSMPQTKVREILKATGLSNGYEDEIRDPEQWSNLAQTRPDILVAEIDDDTLVSLASSTDNVTAQPRYHVQMNKVARALGLKYMTKSDRGEYVEPQRHIRLPDTGMHGTDWDSCMNILRLGLMPSPDKSRYKDVGVTHTTHIFLTTHLDKAAYHAGNAAQKADSFPIILEFKIPDKRLLDPDYDIDTSAEQKHYQDIRDGVRRGFQDARVPQKSMSLSRDTGIFGYKGRIPASHITGLLIPIDWYSEGYIEDTSEGNYRRVSVEDAKRVAQAWKELDLGDLIDHESSGNNPLLQAFDPYWLDEVKAELGERDEDDEDY